VGGTLGGPIVRANPMSKFSDFETLYLRNLSLESYRYDAQIDLRETGLSDGEGLEVIGVRISEIPNYTVKWEFGEVLANTMR